MAAPKPRNAILGLGAIGVVGAIALAIGIHIASESKSVVSGELTIGEAGFRPAHCRSGKVEDEAVHDGPRFHGVDLVAVGGSRSVRVLEDPSEGMRVLVIDEGEAPRPIDRAACERFEVELHETDELINEVWGMEGSLDLACGDASGRVTFAHCYGGR